MSKSAYFRTSIPQIPDLILPDTLNLSPSAARYSLSAPTSAVLNTHSRPSIHPQRDSLRPPLRPKSASSRSSLTLTIKTSRSYPNDGSEGFTFADNDNDVDFSIPAVHNSFNAKRGDSGQEGDFHLLNEEDVYHLQTVSRLEGKGKSESGEPQYDLTGQSKSVQFDRRKEQFPQIPKTPRTPAQFIQDRLSSLPNVIPTHRHLPTPIMPVIHLMLITAHLILNAMIPYLLVQNFIQPLVLWIITVVTALLESVYLLPGIFLEVIGLFRRKPIDSAWLQTGVHLVIMVLSVAPHAATVFLLIVANQVPACPSALIYKEPGVPNFESHLRWSACEALPKVTMISMVNLVVVGCEIVVSSVAIAMDYRIQKKEDRRRSKITDELEDSEKEKRRKRRRTWWREKEQKTKKKARRRWTVGVGKLLWGIEGHIHRAKDRKAEQKAL
ncbi:uncharacterized protein IL334_007126 [Kwoniella shivajii]|uniref:Endoplasmic reticulum protein n=1 Tax=Kwoniella shivajii TaxID=564305 RepID=A0ABZ1D7U7_9TREE|nr:hypothetical protein IL334_007126 [Kwoniella shivajii]